MNTGTTRILGYTLGSLLVGALLAGCKHSDSDDNEPRQTSASISTLADTLSDVPVAFRPKVRWWWPGAWVESAELQREMNLLADAGFGGVEIADVYDSVSAEMDPSVYGWGTERWNSRVKTALQAAADKGMSASITIGPHWPSAIPGVSLDSDAVSQEVIFGQATVAAGERFNGSLPEPVLVPSGTITANPNPPVSSHLVGVWVARCADTCSDSGTVTIDNSSLTEVSDQVVDGSLDWTAPSDGDWLVLPLYSRATGQIVNMYDMHPDNSPVTAEQAYVVNHYGAAGASAVTDYWNNNLLGSDILALLQQTSGAIFEDSLELKQAQVWTSGILDEFEQRRGYSIRPYLPVLMYRTLKSFSAAATPAFAFSDTTLEERVRYDWNTTLSELWSENRLQPLKAWANSHGLKYRNQGYGAPLDVTLSAYLTDQPEGESLAFGEAIDQYRALASGRDLAGKTRLSSELGAFFGAYDTLWHSEMLPAIHAAFDGGVNELYLHGFAYRDAPGASWPGFAPFGAMFAEAWNDQHPTWNHIQDLTGYIARNQYVLQQGVNRSDVLYVRDAFDREEGYSDSSLLLQQGYTLGYLSPAVIARADLQASNGMLMANGSQWRAVVVNSADSLSVAMVERLGVWASAGVPVFMIGDVAARVPGMSVGSDETDSELATAVNALLLNSQVVQLDSEAELVSALNTQDVKPGVSYTTGTTLVNVHRSADGLEYYYFHNNGTAVVDQDVTLNIRGVPYRLDAWSGSLTEEGVFTQDSGSTRIHLALQPQQTTVVVLDTAASADNDEHLVASSADQIVRNSDGLWARVSAAGDVSASFADGKNTTQTVAAVADSITLDNWTLSVESWAEGDSATDTVKTVLDSIDLSSTQNWTEQSAMDTTVGIGTYSTTLTLASAWTGGTGGYLQIGDAVDTLRVRVNGESVGVVDQISRKVDIGPWLHTGDNQIEIEVASNLINLARIGREGQLFLGDSQNYGLLGDVVFQPYGEVQITHP